MSHCVSRFLFRPLAIGAMACTGVACIFITISALLDERDHGRNTHTSDVTFKSYSFSMGTMFFAWGGSAMFPTIQVDMRDPNKFHWSVIIAYIILLIFYMPVSIIGYHVYGSKVADNVLTNLPEDFLRITVEILITGHLGMAFTIVLNPIFQGVEDRLRIPKHFTWKRAVTRSAIVIFLTFIAITIPHFGAILSFIGGSTVSILGFILPVFCYISIKVASESAPNESFFAGIFK